MPPICEERTPNETRTPSACVTASDHQRLPHQTSLRIMMRVLVEVGGVCDARFTQPALRRQQLVGFRAARNARPIVVRRPRQMRKQCRGHMRPCGRGRMRPAWLSQLRRPGWKFHQQKTTQGRGYRALEVDPRELFRMLIVAGWKMPTQNPPGVCITVRLADASRHHTPNRGWCRCKRPRPLPNSLMRKISRQSETVAFGNRRRCPA